MQRRGAAARGARNPTERAAGGRQVSETGVDAFDAKADALALLAALGVATGGLQIAAGGPAYMHPGRSATLRFGPKAVVGMFGELHPAVLEALDAQGPIVGFEIILDDLARAKGEGDARQRRAGPARSHAADTRFRLCGRPRGWRRAISCAWCGASTARSSSALIFSTSTRDRASLADKKSVAVSVTLQPRAATLTEAEIEALGAKIVAEAARKTGAALCA